LAPLYPVYTTQTGLTTGWMFVYTIQPVVQPVVKPDNRLSNRFYNRFVQPVWQQVVSCKRGFRGLANWHLFPEFRDLWSGGPVMPCGDMHLSFIFRQHLLRRL